MARRAVVALFCVAAALCLSAETGYWLDVPFVKQTAEGCGAASIAMVMQYWQHELGRRANGPVSDVHQIQQALSSSQDSVKVRGTLASVLQAYLEKQGFATYVFRGDPALLAHHIRRGRPLIVALEPGSGKQLHYVVVAGIEPDQNLVLLNDPAQRKLLKIDARNFEKEWQGTGNWTLLALPRSAAH